MLANMKFLYARNSESTCHKCNKVIQAGDLHVDNGNHFQCYMDTHSFDGYRKNDIQICLKGYRKSIERERLRCAVSLEDYDRRPGDYELGISVADLTKIREQIALAREHKTAYYTPHVVAQTSVCCIKDLHNIPAIEERLELHFGKNTYHPSCLLKTGKVNLDAKDFAGYNALTDDRKVYLDSLFKKDDNDYFLPKAEIKFVDYEYCSFSKCLVVQTRKDSGCRINGLRIQYKTKSYHPKCFAAMGKVNIDAKEIGNYNSLRRKYQKFLDNHFKKSDVFDIPVIEKAKECDYCNACDCLDASEAPSKLPWPYTITKNQLQIKFHGDLYHPKCFKSTTKINMAAKDFYGYNVLNDEEKQALDELFVRNVVVNGAVDGENGEDLGQSNNAEHGNGDQETKVKIEVKQEDPETIQEDTVPQNNGLQLAALQSDDQNENMVTALTEDVEMQELDSNVAAIDDNENQPSGLQPSTTDDFGDGNNVDGRLGGNHLKRNAEDAMVNIDTDDDDDVFVIEEPLAKKIKTDVKMEANDQPNNDEQAGDITLFKYKTPDDDFIQSILEKLRFPINKQALLFWINVPYTVFTAASTPTATFDISSDDDSFFRALSCFFTGTEENYRSIKRAIQAYFFNNFETFGTISGIDFSRLDTTSNQFDEFYECAQLSNIHFNIICEWLKCRIGIFTPGQDGLQKYGNWDEESHPILLIQNENGFYKPVLTLI